jgi:CHASE2 domain-containing sensor protein
MITQRRIFLLTTVVFALFITAAATDVSFLAQKKFKTVDDYLYAKRFNSIKDKIDNAKNDKIVLVAIDDETVKKLGPLPFKSSIHANALSKILEGAPKVVGVDVVLKDTDDTDDDMKLAAVLKDAKNHVVLAAHNEDIEHFILNWYTREKKTDPYVKTVKNARFVSAANNRVLHKSCYEDITVSSLYIAQFDDGLSYPPLPAAVAAKFLNATFENKIPQDLKYAFMGDTKIPAYVDRDGCSYFGMLINYSGNSDTFKTVSFEKIDQTDPSVFKDKIVLIGTEDSRWTDVYSSPLSAHTPELVIFANAVDTLVTGRFIAPLDMKLQASMVFALGLCVFFTTFYTRRIIALAAAFVSIVGAKLAVDFFFFCFASYVYFVPFACCVPLCFLGAAALKKCENPPALYQ